MVTFSCEVCNESMLKKKADQHTSRCYGAYFTCIDCSTTFNGTDYRQHTQCITEDQKYQGALYRPKKKQDQAFPAPKAALKVKETKKETKEEPKEESRKESKDESKNTDLKKGKKSEVVDLARHKNQRLSKVLKKLSKDDKKILLKRIFITEEGDLKLK